jgi:hypothetical protein
LSIKGGDSYEDCRTSGLCESVGCQFYGGFYMTGCTCICNGQIVVIK